MFLVHSQLWIVPKLKFKLKFEKKVTNIESSVSNPLGKETATIVPTYNAFKHRMIYSWMYGTRIRLVDFQCNTADMYGSVKYLHIHGPQNKLNVHEPQAFQGELHPAKYCISPTKSCSSP